MSPTIMRIALSRSSGLASGRGSSRIRVAIAKKPRSCSVGDAAHVWGQRSRTTVKVIKGAIQRLILGLPASGA